MKTSRLVLASAALATFSMSCAKDPDQPSASFSLTIDPAAISASVPETADVTLVSRYDYRTATGWTIPSAELVYESSRPDVAVVTALKPKNGFSMLRNGPALGCPDKTTCYEPRSGVNEEAILTIQCLSVGVATIEVRGVVEVEEKGLGGTAYHSDGSTASLEVTCTAKTGSLCDPTSEKVGLLSEELFGDEAALCAHIDGAVSSAPTVHSSNEVPPKEPIDVHAAIRSQLYAAVQLNEAEVGSKIMECGQTELGRTHCIDSWSTAPSGDYYIFGTVLGGDLPGPDLGRPMTLGFVFDGDGDANNNYEADPAYPNDWYQATDTWFELALEPGYDWSARAVSAYPAIQPISSAARIIVIGNLVTLIVPASEMASMTPGARATVFEHDGSWGFGGFWQGDVEPPVGEDLLIPSSPTF